MADNNGGLSLDVAPIDVYLDTLPQLGASDLHMKVGAPMIVRIAGGLRSLDMAPITQERAKTLAYSVLSEKQRHELERTGSADVAYLTPKGCRVRVNVFRQRGSLSMSARYVHSHVPTIEDLFLPGAVIKRICATDAGLVLVAGATGSGKTTTIASMIDFINHTYRCHILTIEDPIEYIFTDDKAIINQREVGIDVDTFDNALKYAMREDPDVILMGEMRDAETVMTGLTAAETGHLVFGTLHAASAPQVIGRLLDYFPGDKHMQMRKSLVFNLRAVICQKLLRCSIRDRKRVPACEIMLCTPPIRKHIDEGHDEKLHDIIVHSREDGMIDFTHSLYELVQKRLVTRQEALDCAPNTNALQSLFDGFDIT